MRSSAFSRLLILLCGQHASINRYWAEYPSDCIMWVVLVDRYMFVGGCHHVEKKGISLEGRSNVNL